MFKDALNYLGKYVVAIFMSFFIVVACVSLFTMAMGEKVGYDVFALNKETGKNELLYHHDYADGEDTLYAQYEGQDLVLTKSNNIVLADNFKKAAYFISSVLSILLTVVIIYVTAWNKGNKDINRVQLGKITENKNLGLLAGLIANIPFVALYILLILCRFEVLNPAFLSIFRACNSHLYGIIYWIYGSAVVASDLSILRLLALSITVLFLPIVCWLGYLLGYNDIQIMHRLMYKQK